MIDALVAKGWVRRCENPADKRGKIVLLTEEGARRVSEVRDPVRELESTMLAGLSREERAQLEHLLATVTENLERSSKAGSDE